MDSRSLCVFCVVVVAYISNGPATMTHKDQTLSKIRNAVLHMRCYAEDKAKWRGAARIDSLQLAPWVVRTLNAAAKRQDRRTNGA